MASTRSSGAPNLNALKYIDESDEEGEHATSTALNGGYRTIVNEPNENPPVLQSDFLISEDTACGFWIFRGPVLQKYVLALLT